MTISRFYKDDASKYASSTSLSVTAPSNLQDGDLLVVSYFHRSTFFVPSGWTDHGDQSNGAVSQRTGIATKVAVAGDSDQSFSFTQSSSGRMGLHLSVFRGSVGALAFSQITFGGPSTGFTVSPADITESEEFAVLSTASNVYANGDDSIQPYVASGSGANWERLNINSGGTGLNRLSAAENFFNNETSSDITWETTVTNRALAAASISIVEGAGGGDTTEPVLSNPTGTHTGQTTADGSVDTDEDNGTLYSVVTESATVPSVTQIQAGQDNTGAAAAWSGSQAVSATGTQNVSATGLTDNTTYYFHYQHQDAAGNDSAVVSSGSFTTGAIVNKGVTVTLHDDGGNLSTDITGITASWWDATAPSGAPDFTDTVATDASGVATIDLTTSLDTGSSGFLSLRKDSLAWCGVKAVEDIS